MIDTIEFTEGDYEVSIRYKQGVWPYKIYIFTPTGLKLDGSGGDREIKRRGFQVEKHVWSDSATTLKDARRRAMKLIKLHKKVGWAETVDGEFEVDTFAVPAVDKVTT